MTHTTKEIEKIVEDFDERMVSLSPNKGGFGGFYFGSKNGVELYDFNYMRDWLCTTLLTLQQKHQEEIEKAVEAEREIFNYNRDYER